MNRTEAWDEFPNGRWGDARSPAYGDVDAFGTHLRFSKDEAHELWGAPQTLADLQHLFQRFCAGELTSLPWSDAPVAKETKVIDLKIKME